MKNNYDKRKTNVRIAYNGDIKGYQWLTKKELELVKLLKIKFYPTIHKAIDYDGMDYDPIEVECPAPEICGYFISKEDWNRIQTVKSLMRKKK